MATPQIKVNKDTMSMFIKVIDILTQCIGGVLCIAGIIILLWPFIKGDMMYWPASCIGLAPIVIGGLLAFFKMFKYEKIRIKKLELEIEKEKKISTNDVDNK